MNDKNLILVADDIAMNREILSMMLQDTYNLLECDNGEDALSILNKHKDDIVAVLLDLDMPKMNGYEVLKEMRRLDLLEQIAVLVITSDQDKETENNCLELGAFDFIAKPFYKKLVEHRVHNAISIYTHKKMLEHQIAQKTSDLEKVLQKTIKMSERLERLNEGITDILGTVVEYRSLESGEHIKRVKNFTEILGKAYIKLYPEDRLTKTDLKTIVSASALHDLGKISIPDSILLKPGKLTSEEFELMKKHTTNGANFLRKSSYLWNDDDLFYKDVVIDICEYHHERWDGKGYPKGLKGDEIPLCAQLVAVADVYDALVHERCYKKAIPPYEAYKMIKEGQCGAFSEKIQNALDNAFPYFLGANKKEPVEQNNIHESHLLTSNTEVIRKIQDYRGFCFWEIELQENNTPRLFVDETMEKRGGFDSNMTPEETFLDWQKRVFPEDVPITEHYLNDIIQTGTSEVYYRWIHPTKGLIYVRCGGVLDVSHSKGKRILGFHRFFDTKEEIV